MRQTQSQPDGPKPSLRYSRRCQNHRDRYDPQDERSNRHGDYKRPKISLLPLDMTEQLRVVHAVNAQRIDRFDGSPHGVMLATARVRFPADCALHPGNLYARGAGPSGTKFRSSLPPACSSTDEVRRTAIFTHRRAGNHGMRATITIDATRTA